MLGLSNDTKFELKLGNSNCEVVFHVSCTRYCFNQKIKKLLPKNMLKKHI